MRFSQKNMRYVVKDEDLGISRCMGEKRRGALLPCVTAPHIPLYPSTFRAVMESEISCFSKDGLSSSLAFLLESSISSADSITHSLFHLS
jgi:hypothetical protein